MYLKVIGKMESDLVMEYILGMKDRCSMVNGSMIKCMDKGFLPTVMEGLWRVNLKRVKRFEKSLFCVQVNQVSFNIK